MKIRFPLLLVAGSHITSPLGVTQFTEAGGGPSPAYLTIDQAILWHEKEIKVTDGKWSRAVLDVLLEAKREFKPA